MSMLYGHRNGNTCSCNLKIRRSKYLGKLWCCVGGRIYHNVIWYYQLNWWRKLAAVNSFSWRFECKPFSTVSNEGLTIETSVLKLFTVTNLRHQFNWYWQIVLYSPTDAAPQLFYKHTPINLVITWASAAISMSVLFWISSSIIILPL